MAKQRKLRAGEIALARAAFADKVRYDKVRFSDGPGNNFAALIAFARGNPAITLGSAVYFKSGHYSADFSQPAEDAKSFIHEMTHVWQYQRLGRLPFLARYGAELAAVDFKPNDMYKYKAGTTSFDEAMLEAQASIVADYSVAVWTGNAQRVALLARNVAGSGLYGL